MPPMNSQVIQCSKAASQKLAGLKGSREMSSLQADLEHATASPALMSQKEGRRGRRSVGAPPAALVRRQYFDTSALPRMTWGKETWSESQDLFL